jgi:hypothetical protein
MPESIVRISPEVSIKDDTVQVSVPLHTPPMDTHDELSEMMVVVACASGIVNVDNVKIRTAKIEI